MKYEEWRNELFGLPPESDPVMHEHSEDFYAVPPAEAFDYVDRALLDPDVHALFSKEQIGKGINTIYSNACSDLPFLYTSECDEDRRVVGIENLVNLYRNYFDRHCTANVPDTGNDFSDGPLGYICYMLWDVFVLYPRNATPAMISAAVGVMRSALESSNDNSLNSAIHGLGHWAIDVPEALTTLKDWLEKPTTDNPAVHRYARAVTSHAALYRQNEAIARVAADRGRWAAGGLGGRTSVQVEIVRYTDDYQPGFVECRLTDADNRVWSFVEKVPVVTTEYLDPDSPYPRAGSVGCTVLGWEGEVARIVVDPVSDSFECRVPATALVE